MHLAFLHENGSNSLLGICSFLDHLPMLPYYGIKDGFSIVISFFILFYFTAFMPDKLGHFDNFILANPLITPVHIVPEWYFLPLYAILRSVTDKLLGMFLIVLVIFCLLILPYLCKYLIIRSASLRPIYGFSVIVFLLICLHLGWIGSLPVIAPYLEIGQYLTLAFFVTVGLLFPFTGAIDRACYTAWTWRRTLELYSAHRLVVEEFLIEYAKALFWGLPKIISSYYFYRAKFYLLKKKNLF